MSEIFVYVTIIAGFVTSMSILVWFRRQYQIERFKEHKKYTAPPPGETLLDMAQHTGIKEIATKAEVEASVVAAIISGVLPISDQIAVVLEKGTGMSRTFWKKLQENHDRAQTLTYEEWCRGVRKHLS